jgi:hypothetical protein
LNNNPADMNLLVPKYANSGLALTTTTAAIIENDRMSVRGTDPAQHRVLVFDRKRFPPTGPGQNYDLKTGRVWNG